MFFLILQSLFGSVICNLDTPIVIERPLTHIDWSDLALENNPDIPPEQNMTITLQPSVVATRYDEIENTLRVILDLEQSWQDVRLRFSGETEVSVPPSIKTWSPQTVVHNSVCDEVQRSAMFLTPNGTLRLVERRKVDVVCGDEAFHTPCPLMFRSFARGGIERIGYTISSSSLFPNDISTLRINGREYDTLTVDVSKGPFFNKKFIFSEGSAVSNRSLY